MKNVRCLIMAALLTLAITAAATAGDIQGVGTPAPCPPGDIQGVGCSAPNTGDLETPGLSAINSTLVELLTSLF